MADREDRQHTQSRRDRALRPDALVTTSFFVSNLHCPSCVLSIRKCAEALSPPAELLSHSIISHWVILRYNSSLAVQDVCTALEREGFEIHSTHTYERQREGSPIAEDGEVERRDWQSSLEQAVAKWKQKRNSKLIQTEGNRRHMELCKECQVEAEEIGVFETRRRDSNVTEKSVFEKERQQEAPHRRNVSAPSSENSSFVVIEQPSEILYRASISITGMTCSSCVSSITSSLRGFGWVRSVDVNLITASATVTFLNQDRVSDIVDTIEDVGFEAAVSSVELIEARPAVKTKKGHNDKWQASFTIEGMTCSSCASNIISTLERFQWVDKVDVNLLSNSVAVSFAGKNKLPLIQEAIKSFGYEVTLNSLLCLEVEFEASKVRIVEIRVSGIHCHHCPDRISEALGYVFGESVKIDKTLSLSDPVMRISYDPSLSKLTIRHIIGVIEGADPSFGASIHHPPTLEDRAREMYQREKLRYLLRLLLSVIVAIPTFLIGIVFMDLVSSKNPVKVYLMKPIWVHHVSRSQWALFMLSTPVYFFSADIFHRRALKEIRAMWRPGSKTPMAQRFYRFGSMNMLMSLGTTIAYFSSIAELAMAAAGVSDFSHSGYYFDSVVFLTMFLMMGRYLEAYSKAKTGDAVSSLGNLRPKEAWLVDENEKIDRTVSVDHLEIGDIVRVPHGATPPFDGIVLSGTSKFDESSLTGESKPIEKCAGDMVYSGTINKGAALTIKLTSLSGSSILDKIISIVREGQTKRAPVERVADKITSHFVPLVILVAISTWVTWLVLGKSGAIPHDWKDSHEGGWELWSLRFAIAVFVIACPCGIGLAAPTALFVGGGLAARHGILVKGGGEAFQEASSLDCIVFDKTGTLTEGGDPAVTDHEITHDIDSDHATSLVMKMEENSSHPIARALVGFARNQPEKKIEMISVDEMPGKGLRGVFQDPFSASQNMTAIVGNETLMSEYRVAVPPSVAMKLECWKREGKSIALLATNHGTDSLFRLAAIYAISDPVRPEAQTVISALQECGLSVWMLSGDNPTTAKAVASKLNIPIKNVIGGVLPDQKAEMIRYLQRSLVKEPRHSFMLQRQPKRRRAVVAMVGDGINDSPALSAADVSIAIGNGSDVAVSSAHFILVNSNLNSLLTLTSLSHKVFRRVRFNFAWALIYNVIAMPIAAGVFYPIKTANGTRVRLDPVWASLAMALSSLSVVCSSLLLRSQLPGVGFRAFCRVDRVELNMKS